MERLATTKRAIMKGRIVTPVEYFIHGAPYLRMVDTGNYWAAKVIRDSKSQCILDMTNSGMINAGAGLPTCTKYAYPVYATKQYEDIMVKLVRDARPAAIVYSTDHWQYQIDGKDMRSRFPNLDQFLRQAYPQEECRENYCIRRSKSNS